MAVPDGFRVFFHGFMGGETDQWMPYLFRDHTQICPWIAKLGYNLTTDIANEAINYMRGQDAIASNKQDRQAVLQARAIAIDFG
jgi:hypothetical protein